MPFSSKSFVANFANIISYIFMNTSIPRQVEKFWTGTDWEIFLGGDMGGTANQHRKFGKFRKFMGGDRVQTGVGQISQNFSGGGASLVILGVLPRYGLM